MSSRALRTVSTAGEQSTSRKKALEREDRRGICQSVVPNTVRGSPPVSSRCRSQPEILLCIFFEKLKTATAPTIFPAPFDVYHPSLEPKSDSGPWCAPFACQCGSKNEQCRRNRLVCRAPNPNLPSCSFLSSNSVLPCWTSRVADNVEDPASHVAQSQELKNT